jgi:hypothetical protein
MADDMVREVIWVPIIHSQVDQGSMSESIRRLYIRRVGKQKWEQHVRSVDARWQQIRENLDLLNLDYRRVRLYQDGLPACGHEAKIVQDLAGAGSQNHQLLLDLIGRGAQLMGTESTELLLAEYELAQQVLCSMESGGSRTVGRSQQDASRRTLERRDAFIASRINDTLQVGETGLLFLGMLHSLDPHLPAGIRIRKLATEESLVKTQEGTP